VPHGKPFSDGASVRNRKALIDETSHAGCWFRAIPGYDRHLVNLICQQFECTFSQSNV
jgi:hypothetical protein